MRIKLVWLERQANVQDDGTPYRCENAAMHICYVCFAVGLIVPDLKLDGSDWVHTACTKVRKSL